MEMIMETERAVVGDLSVGNACGSNIYLRSELAGLLQVKYEKGLALRSEHDLELA